MYPTLEARWKKAWKPIQNQKIGSRGMWNLVKKNYNNNDNNSDEDNWSDEGDDDNNNNNDDDDDDDDDDQNKDIMKAHVER